MVVAPPATATASESEMARAAILEPLVRSALVLAVVETIIVFCSRPGSGVWVSGRSAPVLHTLLLWASHTAVLVCLHSIQCKEDLTKLKEPKMNLFAFTFFRDYLKDHGYSLDKRSVERVLTSNEDFPGISAFSDALSYFGVENIVAEVPKEMFDSLPVDDFIAMTLPISHEAQLVRVKRIGDDKIVVTYGSDKKETLTKDAFLQIWTGILLSIEPNEHKLPKEGVSPKKRNRQLIGVLVIGVLLSLGVLVLGDVSFAKAPFMLYSFLSFCGLLLGILLVREGLGMDLGKASQICQISSITDCSHVLLSKGAEPIKGITLSDLSVVYFAATFLLSLFLPQYDLHRPLFVVSVFSLVAVAYSIYYQGRVLRLWCPLCLGVSTVLLAQFATLLLIGDQGIPTLMSAGLTLLLFSLVGLSWMLLRPLLEKVPFLQSQEIQFHSLKRDQEVLKLMLQRAKKVDLQGLGPDHVIWLGDSDAPVRLIGITNPGCGMCKHFYSSYLHLLRTRPGVFNVGLVFCMSQDKDDESASVALRLYELDHTVDREKVLEALDDWYGKSLTLEEWQRKWGVGDTRFAEVLEGIFSWCESNNIDYTPETILGTSLFPDYYEVTDLLYFQDTLADLYSDTVSEEDILPENTYIVP